MKLLYNLIIVARGSLIFSGCNVTMKSEDLLDAAARSSNSFLPSKIGTDGRARGSETAKERKRPRERKEAEGNDDRVRHVPKAQTMSLCRRERAASRPVTFTCLLHACNTHTRVRDTDGYIATAREDHNALNS